MFFCRLFHSSIHSFLFYVTFWCRYTCKGCSENILFIVKHLFLHLTPKLMLFMLKSLNCTVQYKINKFRKLFMYTSSIMYTISIAYIFQFLFFHDILNIHIYFGQHAFKPSIIKYLPIILPYVQIFVQIITWTVKYSCLMQLKMQGKIKSKWKCTCKSSQIHIQRKRKNRK